MKKFTSPILNYRHRINKKNKKSLKKALQIYQRHDNIMVSKEERYKTMTIEKICKMLNIKGLIHCSESDKFISVTQNGKTWLYNKATKTLRAL